MGLSKAYLCSVLLATGASAFPQYLLDTLASRTTNDPLAIRADTTSTASASATPTFNAQEQYIDTTGAHKFVPPGPGDERGPCPGLNAMANHNYLPHNGYATIPQFVSACVSTYGMGGSLATVLAAYGAVLDGEAILWSIGGLQHTGISGSHNNYESDSSPLRSDINQYGSNGELVMGQFRHLYNMQPNPATANYDINVLGKFRSHRLSESIAKNPWFYYGPFSGTVVTQAAYAFIFRFMGNKSAEHPEGYLNKAVLKSFMSIHGPEDKLYWKPGYERIPNNWYRRANNDPYDFSQLGADIDLFQKIDPRIAQPGCNTGKVNHFHKINVTSQSGGAYNETAILADPICYGLSYAIGALGFLSAVGSAVENLLLPIQNTLGCITVPDVNQTAAAACPGYSLFGGPNGTVAKGAIQDKP